MGKNTSKIIYELNCSNPKSVGYHGPDKAIMKFFKLTISIIIACLMKESSRAI